MITTDSSIASRLAEIRHRINAACRHSGRSDDSVDLIAVSKNHPSQLIELAFEAGQRSFGENYAQELSTKQSELGYINHISWHFIGHLQSNKAKSVVGRCNLIQSVDSEQIAGKIARIALSSGINQKILVEVNIGGDISKTGIAYDEALPLCDRVSEMHGVQLIGLMGIAPSTSRNYPSRARASFAQLKWLFDRLPLQNRQVLSMGMSGDFEDAIAEGSTMVRIGSALFGQRPGISTRR